MCVCVCGSGRPIWVYDVTARCVRDLSLCVLTLPTFFEAIRGSLGPGDEGGGKVFEGGD